MSLESLISPIKWADQQLLREYTKATKKWEEKVGNKYVLCTVLNISSFVTVNGTNEFFYTLGSVTVCRGIDLGITIAGLITGSHNGIKIEDNKKIIDNIFAYQVNKITTACRTPLFFFGLSTMVKGTYDLYNYLANNEPTLSEGLDNLRMGYSSFVVASSIFLKNNEPKLLNKDPLWKQAYNWTKEKLSSLTPHPAPQPIPVQSYARLEDYF